MLIVKQLLIILFVFIKNLNIYVPNLFGFYYNAKQFIKDTIFFINANRPKNML